MKRKARLIKIIFILILFINFPYIGLGQNGDSIISRPVIEYSSGDLRDPFGDLFNLAAEKEKKEKEMQSFEAPLEEAEVAVPMPSLDKFKVQGVIWGGNFPQAIINNKVLSIGDSIEGVKIINIEKKGITLSFAGRTANLPTPGNAPALEKGDKEEK